jgi:hypothetical protein
LREARFIGRFSRRYPLCLSIESFNADFTPLLLILGEGVVDEKLALDIRDLCIPQFAGDPELNPH